MAIVYRYAMRFSPCFWDYFLGILENNVGMSKNIFVENLFFVKLNTH